jgi:hypothetical protein
VNAGKRGELQRNREIVLQSTPTSRNSGVSITVLPIVSVTLQAGEEIILDWLPLQAKSKVSPKDQ